MTEIDKIKQNSSRAELIEMLQNPENDYDSLILIHHSTDNKYGFFQVEGSSTTAIIGMLRVITQHLEQKEVVGFNDNESEDE